jgi:hypothetical protein
MIHSRSSTRGFPGKEAPYWWPAPTASDVTELPRRYNLPSSAEPSDETAASNFMIDPNLGLSSEATQSSWPTGMMKETWMFATWGHYILGWFVIQCQILLSLFWAEDSRGLLEGDNNSLVFLTPLWPLLLSLSCAIVKSHGIDLFLNLGSPVYYLDYGMI